jgi:hypothetical protein
MWIGLARPEIVNTQADQYRPVFKNPVHMDVKPAARTSDPEGCCGRYNTLSRIISSATRRQVAV